MKPQTQSPLPGNPTLERVLAHRVADPKDSARPAGAVTSGQAADSSGCALAAWHAPTARRVRPVPDLRCHLALRIAHLLLPLLVLAAALLLTAPLAAPPEAVAATARTAGEGPTTAVRAAGLGAEAPDTRRHPTDWIPPVPGAQVVKGFDPPEQDWLSGHRGVDLAALPGEPVRAPASGTVRFAGHVAGKPVVSVLAGGWIMSVENVDAEVGKGDEVSAGHTIGTVADPPHCHEGCVHVGIRRDGRHGVYWDPLPFFGDGDIVLLPEAHAPEEMPAVPPDTERSGAGPWGGHQNGRIPAVAMCPLAEAPGHRLRCDAARAFDALNAAFAQQFGATISVTDSYRDYETQVVLKRRKGRMAATPGTSNHGWGLAVDLGSGINRFGTAQHEWMRQNAPRFGWIHPAWARQNGSLPEAWHWEYAGGTP